MSNNEKSDVELAKKIAIVSQINRTERLQACVDYIGFVIRVIFGVIFLIGGTIETLDPAIMPITPNKPELYMGIGLSLLVGEKIVSIIAKVTNLLKA